MGEVSYKSHRYPAEIIAHCVWLYHRFPLSFREVEELMVVRGPPPGVPAAPVLRRTPGPPSRRRGRCQTSPGSSPTARR